MSVVTFGNSVITHPQTHHLILKSAAIHRTEFALHSSAGRLARKQPTAREETMTKDEIKRMDEQGLAAWDKHDANAFVGMFADKFT